MNHFLSRVGRTPFGRHFMPTAALITVGSYLGLHTISHDLIRKLFVAQGSDGEPIQISDYLRDMITDVFVQVDKSGFHVDLFKLKDFVFPTPIIRWFVSSTLDPIVYGMTDFATGVSIGVPSFYDYREPDDLPDEVFEIKKFSMFRSPKRGKLDDLKEAEKESKLVETEKKPIVLVRKIDKNSQEGKDYVDSLILSDDAKRFSLARALYISDSYRPALHTLAIALTTAGAITISRAYVDVLKLRERHVTHRMPGYALAGVLCIGLYMFIGGAVDEYVEKKATDKAKSLGENYIAGAEEYFRKQEIRNGLLGIKPSKYF